MNGPHADQADIAKNRVIAALGYLWILCLLPLLGRKHSRFAQFHGKQGFVIFTLSLAVWILGWLPLFGWLIWLIMSILLGLLSLAGIVQALRGKYWELPYLGAYAKKIII